MNPIIIIGMHRSGTSMLTKLLQKLGVFVGVDLDDNNESQFFVNLNDWALCQAGATWDNPYNFNFIDDYFINHVRANFQKHVSRNRMVGYGKNIGKLASGNALWGWKDPRNTFTLPMWQQIFPQAKILHIYRNPVDVAASLRKREQIYRKQAGTQTRTGIRKKWNERNLSCKRIYSQSLRSMQLDEGIALWEQYTRQAIGVKQNSLHLAFERLLSEPQNVLREVLSFLDLNVDEQKISDAIVGINADRKYAFLHDDELVSAYKRIITNDLVVQLGYANIV